MTDPDDFEAAIGHVRTHAGGFFPGQGARVRGRPLHEHCQARGWFDLYLLSLTGRQFEAAAIEMLETVWTYTSYADPRIWNNRIAALAGSAHASPGLAIGAAIAASDAHIYGLGPIMECYDFLAAHAHDDDAGFTEAVRSHRRQGLRFGGYGRPIVAEDERIGPLMARARVLGLADGPAVGAAFRLEQILATEGLPLRMNYGALVAAFCLDLGLNRSACAAYVATLFLGGMPAVWTEARDQPTGLLFPTPVSAIRYDGQMPRKWAHSQANQLLERSFHCNLRLADE